MTSAGRVAFSWVACVAVICVCGILGLAIDPQVEVWQNLLEMYNILPDTGLFLIGIYRMSLLIAAVGTVIWAVISSLADENDTYSVYEGGY